MTLVLRDRFLVEATQVIERHVGTEGLFRKSGSLARQKELRVSPQSYTAYTRDHDYKEKHNSKQISDSAFCPHLSFSNIGGYKAF